MDPKSTHDKKLLLEFIDLYKSLACLWNRQHRGYALRNHRLEAYNQLLQKYREIDENATLHTVKNRLGHIRCGFIRELKKVRMSQEMTSDPSLLYQPTLWYYNSCTFLMDQYCPVKYSERNKMKESHYKNEEQGYHTEYLDSQLQAEYLEESSNSSEDQLDPLDRKRKKVELIVKSESTEDGTMNVNETECIAKALALQMRGLDPYQSVIANKLISDTIFYARLGKLTASAYVVASDDSLHQNENEDLYP